MIEPGGVKTPIWQKGNALADEMVEGMPPEAKRLYGKVIATMREGDRQDRAEDAASSRARWPR